MTFDLRVPNMHVNKTGALVFYGRCGGTHIYTSGLSGGQPLHSIDEISMSFKGIDFIISMNGRQSH